MVYTRFSVRLRERSAEALHTTRPECTGMAMCRDWESRPNRVGSLRSHTNRLKIWRPASSGGGRNFYASKTSFLPEGFVLGAGNRASGPHTRHPDFFALSCCPGRLGGRAIPSHETRPEDLRSRLHRAILVPLNDFHTRDSDRTSLAIFHLVGSESQRHANSSISPITQSRASFCFRKWRKASRMLLRATADLRNEKIGFNDSRAYFCTKTLPPISRSR